MVSASNDGDNSSSIARENLTSGAAEWAAGGCVVQVARPDGSKVPVGKWRDISAGTTPPPSIRSVQQRLASGQADGIGIICGAVSGQLEMVEAEGRAAHLLADLAQRAAAAGLAEQWQRLMTGCSEISPNEGQHFFLRVSDGPALPNTKLALQAKQPDGTTPCLFETRGQGGWVVVAPSCGRTHPSGRAYRFATGSPATIPTFTVAERDALYDIFKSADESGLWDPPPPDDGGDDGDDERPRTPIVPVVASSCDGAIGEAFTAGTSWADILLPSGWKRAAAFDDAHGIAWNRPGDPVLKKSASTGGPHDTLLVWSSSAGLPVQQAMTRFRAWVLIQHGGDFTAAADAVHAGMAAGLTFQQIAAGQSGDDVPWPSQAAAHQRCSDDDLRPLADLHGVEVQTLRQIGCGWDGSAWTFPMRDGTGQMVGLYRRHSKPWVDAAGRKVYAGAARGSLPGLVYADDWQAGDGAVLVVETITDLVGCRSVGLRNVIRRPKVHDALEPLAALLAGIPAARPVIVVARNEQSPDGTNPASDAAALLARDLTDRLGREVKWSHAPDGAADLLGYVRAVVQLLGDRAKPQHIADGIVQQLVWDAVAVAPKPQPLVEVMQQPAPVADLAQWREAVTAARCRDVRRVGLHLDRSPTGSGKTFSTMEAIRQAGVSSALIVLPTHANCQEMVGEAAKHGIDAVAYPPLDQTTCPNIDEAKKAQRAGLVVGAAVCPGCKYNTTCGYQRGTAAANAAPFRICTDERLVRSRTVTNGVQLVVIDEKPDAVVQPNIVCSPRGIDSVLSLAAMLRRRSHGDRLVCLDDEGNTREIQAFAGSMYDVADAVLRAVESVSEPGRVVVDLPARGEVPKDWQAILWRNLQRGHSGHVPAGDAFQLVSRAAAGEIAHIDIVTDRLPNGALNHLVFAWWRTPLPDVPIVMLDATADRADLERMAGRPVDDSTPSGSLLPAKPVRQLVVPVCRGKSPERVAALVADFLDQNPTVQRLGIIGHSTHIDALPGLLQPSHASRVMMMAYFGQGPDRGSNVWHVACDHLLVIGTPRPNPGDVRRRLLQLGRDDAAALPDGSWGEIQWQAMTTCGKVGTFKGMGYHDPEWRHAHASICRAALQQAIGRARSIITDGIPVTVMADEPTGLPVDLAPVNTLPAAVREVVALLERCAGGCPSFPIGNPYRESETSGVTTAELLAAAGSPRSTVMRQLAAARKMGAVIQPSRGRWAVAPPKPSPLVIEVAAPLVPSVVVAAVPPEVVTVACTSAPPAVDLAAVQPLPDAQPDVVPEVHQQTVSTPIVHPKQSRAVARLLRMKERFPIPPPLEPEPTLWDAPASLPTRAG